MIECEQVIELHVDPFSLPALPVEPASSPPFLGGVGGDEGPLECSSTAGLHSAKEILRTSALCC